LNNDLLKAFPKEIKDKDGKVTRFNRSDYINDAVRSKMIADGWM
jgi:hypothetical protein